MKRILSIVMAGFLVTMFCSLALAEEKKENVMGKGMMQGGMMAQQGRSGEEGMMMGKGKMTGMSGMCGMMMNSMMMGKSLVATSDGGIIVMMGNRLQKYDKDLVLQKEVEIKIDMEGMQKMMIQMMEKCPMHEKMMEGGMMGQGKEESKETQTSSVTSGHETHHQ
jgi:hypothetical protein